jgi:hypothetical protein
MTHGACDPSPPHGAFVLLHGEEYYRISDHDRMPAFLMSIASDSDLWMFITSRGGLTAGRVDADGSLFPYETVDKLHDAHGHTGPITLLRVRRGTGPDVMWQPLSARSARAAGDLDSAIERNVYKNAIGNRLVFEEIHHDLDLVFRYRWAASDALGWVRTATLMNRGSKSVAVSMLDGLRNVLPYGAPLALYQQSSSLVDAYKHSEYDPQTRLGIFALTSRIVDRPEAAEELRANTVWCHGLEDFEVRLSLDAVAAFRCAKPGSGRSVLTGQRGNYLVVSSFELEAAAGAKWHIVADVGRSHVQVAELRLRLQQGGALDREVEDRLRNASANLLRNVASADGLQLTGDSEASVHHFTNVLFNNMRGGVFTSNYDIPTTDLKDFLHARNRTTASRHAAWLQELPEKIPSTELVATAERSGDADLVRLGYEYLPIYFGRRHGDPSRPWNCFAIQVRKPDGNRALRYEGNWRDIFQNWEALTLSFPGFLPSIIAKFVNASTVDGFNPYRISSDGVDWEVVDPGDPWSHIGYWGDHQIIYLLKFLEALARFSPGALEKLLVREIYCYADVPYRLKPYEEVLRDPRATIVFDTERAEQIEFRVRVMGSDGRLVVEPNGSVYHVSLLEKLLVPMLCKLSNFVPGAGIWMNTQRPEWNDANNALVGNGVSVVTLCDLRRYLRFLERLLDGAEDVSAAISCEVVVWLRGVSTILCAKRSLLRSANLHDGDRKQLLDALGGEFSRYRDKVYAGGFSGKQELRVGEIVELCDVALECVDHAIRANKREDGLYHAYSLLEFKRNGVAVRHLHEMLEGQVAALSSGIVDAEEAVQLLSSLFEGRLYRSDQRSFLLYPERVLPRFVDKNVVPSDRVEAVPLLRELLEQKDGSLLEHDTLGVCRFHADFRNAHDVSAALDVLATRARWAEAVARDRQAVLDVFEATFEHQSFTGRSATMYAYEGIGCVYWHMVAKLLLAVQEVALRAEREGQPKHRREALVQAYYRIRDGLGFNKTVCEHGAFPTDPYSHTPRHAGAQQPGMTGQVKEGILTRFGELGVQVQEGVVRFRPLLLRRGEFRDEPGTYRFFDLDGQVQNIDVPVGGLAFSFCQVPIVYEVRDNGAWIAVTARDGEASRQRGDALDSAHSRALFERRGEIARIDVGISEHVLCSA